MVFLESLELLLDLKAFDQGTPMTLFECCDYPGVVRLVDYYAVSMVFAVVVIVSEPYELFVPMGVLEQNRLVCVHDSVFVQHFLVVCSLYEEQWVPAFQ